MKLFRHSWSAQLLLVLMLASCGMPAAPPQQIFPTATIPVAEPILDTGNAPVEPLVPVINSLPQPEGTPIQATLKAESGQVEVHRLNESGYSSLAAGQSISVGAGDVIRTGSNGLARLTFEANTETTIFSNSVLVVDSLMRTASDATDLRLMQLLGRTFNRVNFATRGSQQEFTTPYGVASVRGTSYWLEVTIEGSPATILRTQTLDAFEAQLGASVSSNNMHTLALLVADLLRNTHGNTQLDVDFGVVVYADTLGNVVEINTCVSALASVDANGRPSQVATFTSTLCTESASASSCGDGSCDPYLGETTATCRADCGTVNRFCGDGSCDPYLGETTATCRADCGTVNRFCGDGSCDPYLGETTVTCRADCR